MRCILIALLFLFSACTALTTKEKSVATGSVVGAGIGAVVGSQTGSAGIGTAIGAVAGAGAGALVGHEFEKQETVMDEQDETIARQKRMLDSQKQEIEELRRMSQDNVDFIGTVPSGTYSKKSFDEIDIKQNAYDQAQPIEQLDTFQREPVRNYAQDNIERVDIPTVENPTTNVAIAEPKMVEPSLGGDGMPSRSTVDNMKSRASYGAWKEQQPNREVVGQTESEQIVSKFNTPECIEASQEVSEARQVTEVADKLYRYRRALRLCPSNPAYHNGLGEIYVELDRVDDAKFEFNEALKLDPGYNPAMINLQSLP